MAGRKKVKLEHFYDTETGDLRCADLRELVELFDNEVCLRSNCEACVRLGRRASKAVSDYADAVCPPRRKRR